MKNPYSRTQRQKRAVSVEKETTELNSAGLMEKKELSECNEQSFFILNKKKFDVCSRQEDSLSRWTNIW